MVNGVNARILVLFQAITWTIEDILHPLEHSSMGFHSKYSTFSVEKDVGSIIVRGNVTPQDGMHVVQH